MDFLSAMKMVMTTEHLLVTLKEILKALMSDSLLVLLTASWMEIMMVP